MSQATRAGHKTLNDYLERAVHEGLLWLIIAIAAFLLLALFSYSPQDPGWSYVDPQAEVTNLGGQLGAWFADAALWLFGVFAYAIPLMLVWSAWTILRANAEGLESRLLWLILRWIGFLLVMIALTTLASLYVPHWGQELANGSGGALGLFGIQELNALFGKGGALLPLIGLLLIGFPLLTRRSPLIIVDGVGGLVLFIVSLLHQAAERTIGTRQEETEPDDAEDDQPAPPPP